MNQDDPNISKLTLVAFANAVLFLVSVAASIHWLDGTKLAPTWWIHVVPILWGLSLVLSALEFARHDNRSLPALRTLALVIMVPPFRLAVIPGKPGWSWLPKMGWLPHDRQSFRRLERTFAAPMIIIAGLMLPILAIELFWHSLANEPWVQVALNLGTSAIWMAFTFEFIVMISVSQERLKYCARHWLDIIIILLPLVSYLRTARLLRLGKIAKTLRAYRMRSLTTKLFQGATTADLLGFVLRRTKAQRIDHLHKRINHHREEIAELELLIEKLRREE